MSSELRNSELNFQPGNTDTDFVLVAFMIHDADAMSFKKRYKTLCFRVGV